MNLAPEVVKARAEMRVTACRMLAEKLSYIEGARRIVELRSDARIDDLDPDILPFVGIASETDALPFGKVREFWQPEALIRLQPEIDRLERWAATFGRQPCVRLIERLSEPGI